MFEAKIIKGFRLTSPYGYRTHPVTGEKNSFHNGIDFVGNGTRLLAIAPGRIIESDFDEISGNFIKVEYIINGVKYLFSYCHLKNKVVIITGSCRSLGECLAKMFLEKGANVIVNDRVQSRLDDAKKKGDNQLI